MKDSNSNFITEPENEYNSNRDFTSLECWKKCNETKIFFYQNIIPKLSPNEKFNLDIQIRKAAVSITANIAEGYGRFHFREGIQFYRISRASLYELKDHLISCKEFGYIDQIDFNLGTDLIEESKKILNGYINFVKRKLKHNQ